MSESHPTIGALLRSLRARKGFTLKEMSSEIGIPLSTLSKVENDRLTLTYDKLQQISQRLGIGMAELFAGTSSTPEPAVVTARRSVTSQSDAVRVTTDNYDYFYLCPELRRKRMIPVLTRVRAKTLSQFGLLMRHPGEEYVHVLEGRVRVYTEFYDPVDLNTGEGIYIDSNMGHAYVAAEGCDEALLLGVCSSDDDDHMHALLSIHDQRKR